MAKSKGVGEIDVFDDLSGVLYNRLYCCYRFSSSNYVESYIDLKSPCFNVRGGVRRSYKSHINWATRNIDYICYDSGNIGGVDLVKVKYLLRGFLAEAIGRHGDHMPDWVFDATINAIRDFGGELILFHDKLGCIVGLIVSVYFDGVAYYSLAGSASVGNKNISPYFLVTAVERAASRGMEYFVLDRCYRIDTSDIDSHAKNLHFYKMGFTDSFMRNVSLKVKGPWL